MLTLVVGIPVVIVGGVPSATGAFFGTYSHVVLDRFHVRKL